MSDPVICIGDKKILLSRALKYYDNQERCQRKLSLTPKEYTKLLDKIISVHNKQIKSAALPQRPVQPQQQAQSQPQSQQVPFKAQPQQVPFHPQQQVPFHPQQQAPSQPRSQQVPFKAQPQQVPFHPQQQAPFKAQSQQVPFKVQPQQAFEAQMPPQTSQRPQWYDMIAHSNNDGQVQQNNAALLERRFFNNGSMNTPVCFTAAPNPPPGTGTGTPSPSTLAANRVFDLIIPNIPIMSRNPSNTRLQN